MIASERGEGKGDEKVLCNLITEACMYPVTYS